jgi:hypothetical protein
MKTNLRKILQLMVLISILLLFQALYTHAESKTQTITLNHGWNAIFMEVKPENPEAAVVFAPDKFTPTLVDPASIWKWNHRTSTVEFVQNPDVPVPEQSNWLVYYTGEAPEYQFISNLHAIHGNSPYLIYISGDAVEWAISGEHTIPSIDWKPNSYNFVGFHLDENIQTNYSTFFDGSFAHAGQKIYTLGNGNWVETADTEFMDYGQAFWIYCNGSSGFTGPLSVQIEQGTGLHYGKTLDEQNLKIYNNSETDKNNIAFSLDESNVPLYYWVFDPVNDSAGWEPFPPDLLSIPLGKSQRLRLGVKRAGLTANITEKTHLKVTDGEGMTIFIPVSVTGISYSGLWVGNAVITKVNEPANDNPNELFKTGSEFSFRLILHSEETGPVRILSQVFQMWDEASGNYVLFTDDSLIPYYLPAAIRDGQPVGRRISAPVFPRLTADNAIMTGNLNPNVGSTLTKNITLLNLM